MPQVKPKAKKRARPKGVGKRRKPPQLVWSKVARKVKAAFRAELPWFGIKSPVFRTESLAGTKLHRVFVTDPGFGRIPHWDRQDIVWRIATTRLSAQERGLISMIVPLSPDELY